MSAARLLACLLCLISPAAGRGFENQQSEEAFRLRIANTQHGGVELSVDSGKTWLLIARVARPATETASGGDSLPTVQRVSPGGMAFGVGGRRVVRLLPDSPPARRDRAAILVNVRASAALFKDFLPPVGSPVQQVLHQRAVPLRPNYAPRDNDVLQITAARSDLSPDRIADYARDASERYHDDAISRLRSRGGTPVSGMLTVTARLAPGDSPEFVTFVLNGIDVAIINRPPYEVHWDTRAWTRGEHLIEVRARDASGNILSRAKTLVVVDNRS